MTIQNKSIIKISDKCSVVSGEQIGWLLQRVQKLKSKSSRCKDTIDWVEVEYGDEYKKVKKGEVGY